MNKKPEVGMGATHGIGSDRYPYTVVEVISDKRIVIQADNYKRIDENGPYTENQTYEYTPNPEGGKIIITLRKNGKWKKQGESLKAPSRYYVGGRNAHYDPHR